jgi:hypothetical protein
MAFRGKVDDPYGVGGAAQVLAHACESGAVEETRDGDERDDAAIGWVALKDLP